MIAKIIILIKKERTCLTLPTKVSGIGLVGTRECKPWVAQDYVFLVSSVSPRKKKTHDESIKQREIFVPPFEVVQGVRLRQMQDAKNSNATVSFSIKQVMVRYYQVVHHAYPIQISQEWKVVPPPLPPMSKSSIFSYHNLSIPTNKVVCLCLSSTWWNAFVCPCCGLLLYWPFLPRIHTTTLIMSELFIFG